MPDDTEATLSRRGPVPVSSTSSLDSSATAAQHQHAHSGQANHMSSSFNSAAMNDVSLTTALHDPGAFLFSDEDMSPLMDGAPASSSTSSTLVPIMPLSSPPPAAAPSAPVPNANTVPEFLYQLTKMLTDDNREIIEWANGKIEVHSPQRLQSEVLNRYFRHSKFASFQRQLNYFGFRKLAGKGKMAPCSYVNEAASRELSSLLLIKRKSGAVLPAPKHKPLSSRKRDRTAKTSGTGISSGQSGDINPVLKGILDRSQEGTEKVSVATSAKIAVGRGVKHQLNGYLKNQGLGNLPTSNDHKALARAAAGKGVRHSFLMGTFATTAAVDSPATSALAAASGGGIGFTEPSMDIQSSLSQLTTNFKNSLKETSQATDTPDAASMVDQDQNLLLESTGLGFLSRDSSLVNLAMLPVGDDTDEAFEPTPVSEMRNSLMSFVDFPQDPSVSNSAENPSDLGN